MGAEVRSLSTAALKSALTKCRPGYQPGDGRDVRCGVFRAAVRCMSACHPDSQRKGRTGGVCRPGACVALTGVVLSARNRSGFWPNT